MATAQIAAQPTRLTELTLDFLGALELERGLSRNTLEAYRSDLQQYGAFLGRGGLDPLRVGARDLAAFVSELAEGREGKAPVAPATLQRKIACLRSFYRHLRREQIIDHDPTAELRPPRARGRLPKVLSRDEVGRLLEQPRGTSPAALRDRALLETMYACGLRASEAITLELSELDLEAGMLRARGKGSKERLVPIGSKAIDVGRDLPRSRPSSAGRSSRRAAGVRQPARRRPLAPGALQDRPGARAQRRARAPHEPAHPAPHLRHPSAGRRL